MKSTLNIRLKVLSRAVRQKINKVKGMQIGKEEVKLVLLVNDIVLCRENPKDSTKKKKKKTITIIQ